MMFGLERLHFIREEDEFFALSSVSRRPGADNEKALPGKGTGGPDLLFTS